MVLYSLVTFGICIGFYFFPMFGIAPSRYHYHVVKCVHETIFLLEADQSKRESLFDLSETSCACALIV